MCVQRHQLTFTHSQAISHFKLSIWYRFVCAKAPTHIHSHTSKALSNHQWCRRLKCRRDTHTKSGATQKAGAHTKGWYTHKRLVHTQKAGAHTHSHTQVCQSCSCLGMVASRGDAPCPINAKPTSGTYTHDVAIVGIEHAAVALRAGWKGRPVVRVVLLCCPSQATQGRRASRQRDVCLCAD